MSSDRASTSAAALEASGDAGREEPPDVTSEEADPPAQYTDRTRMVSEALHGDLPPGWRLVLCARAIRRRSYEITLFILFVAMCLVVGFYVIPEKKPIVKYESCPSHTPASHMMTSSQPLHGTASARVTDSATGDTKTITHDIRSSVHGESEKETVTVSVHKSCVVQTVIETGCPPGSTQKSSLDTERRTKSNSTLYMCERTGCVTSAAETLVYMDSEADPCIDFFQSACGSFGVSRPVNSHDNSGVAELLAKRNMDKVLTLLSKHQYYNGSSAVSKARTFYTSCLNSDVHNKKNVGKLALLVNSFGGMELFNSWAPKDWNFTAVFHNATTAHLVTAFFGIKWNPLNNEMVLELPQLELDMLSVLDTINMQNVNSSDLRKRKEEMDKLVENDTRNTIKRVLQLLEWDSGSALDRTRPCQDNCVENVVDDIVDIELQLQEIKPYDPRYIIVTPREPRPRVSMSDMQTLVKEVNWRKLVDELYGEGHVPSSVRFVLPSRTYIAGVGRIIAAAADKQLHHFMMWRLIRHYLISLGPAYAALNQELDFGSKTRFRNREQQCFNILMSHLAPVVQSLFLLNHVGEQNLRDVKDLVEEVKTELKNSFGWMTEYSQERTKEVVDGLTIHFGHSDKIMDLHKLDEQYENLKLSRTYFIDSLMAVRKFEARGAMITSWPFKSRYSNPDEVSITYVPILAQLQIPYGALQVPWFHHDLPPYLNAAALGSVIVAYLSKPVLEHHHLPTMGEAWDAETRRRYRDHEGCLYDTYSSRNVTQSAEVVGYTIDDDNLFVWKHDITVSPELSIPFIAAEHFAYQISYRLFKRLLDNEHPEGLPGLRYTTAEQSFFLAYAQARCDNDLPHWHKSDDDTPYLEMPRKALINSLVLNDRNFRKAYGCQDPIPAKYKGDTCTLRPDQW